MTNIIQIPSGMTYRSVQDHINADIQAIRCAMEDLTKYAGMISPEDKTTLSRLYIGFGDLSEMIKDEI